MFSYRPVFRPFVSAFSFAFTSILALQPIAVAAAPIVPPPVNDRNVRQALNRLTFGAKPGDFEAVKKMGVKAFIEQQLSPDTIDDSVLDKKLEKLPTLMLSNPTIAELYNPPKPPPTPTPVPAASPDKSAAVAQNKADEAKAETDKNGSMVPAAETPKPSPTPAAKPATTPTPKNPNQVVTQLQQAKLLRAVYSDRQLYEVMVDFWENHFSIYANKDADRWLLTGFDRDSVRPYTMGRFRDLLGATAKSPAMLFYLDNWNSSVLRTYPATKDKPERHSGGINENYARELMELHTMGVDGGYTQKDVQEVARCFTGWTIRKPNEEGIFFYNPAQHDNGPKEVLGVKIPAGGGIGDGERVLDILASHPSTAKFIATKLARRFLGDDPPATAIARASKVFSQTGGSITETLRTIITGPEFFSPQNFQTKVRTPFEFVAAAIRSTGSETDANRPILDWIGRMGQPVYGRITPDGYPDKGAEWLSNNDLLARFNFAAALATNKIPGSRFDPRKIVDRAIADDPSAVAATLIRELLMDQASKKTRESFAKIVAEKVRQRSAPLTPVSTAWNPANGKPGTSPTVLDGVTEMVALILGTPEFQKK
ncbi:MAG: DUF1800 domain-containing protein [Acidobacteriota bacterium]